MRTFIPFIPVKYQLAIFFIAMLNLSRAQVLKSIVYDFDGLDIGQTDLPEGDYRVNDLSYQIAANPLGQHEILGDRVLKLNLNWSTNYGAFGRGISRYIEFNPSQDVFNFYFYNPTSNNQSAMLDVVITDDDNQSNTYEYASDDTWKKSLTIPGSSGWQLFSIPLSQFTDINPGGNGIFDMTFTQNKGMLLMVEFRFVKPASNIPNPVFYLDLVNFSEGTMPTGSTIFNLPPKTGSDYCLLGAYRANTRGNEYLIPSQFESQFPTVAGKKIKFVNYFHHFASDGGSVPNDLPGNEVQTLLNNGYRPVITWEPMFKGMDRLDPRQPRLSNIINGNYNSYIDAFADKVKTFSDTVIIRFMHEFEGNWYSWSLVHNNKDPNLYVNAFRTVVNRFRARGATKVKWMWCVNSDYFPYEHYNWVVPAYPGDSYVDIIATDIYNNHYPPNLPWWRSFKWQTTETYYYLTKYFPNKPLYICEVGCRERFSSENPGSESKAAWFARMDKELQSDYRKARALIFFDSAPDQNWFVNSSPSSLQSLTDNIWYDDYYFKTTGTNLTVNITSPANNSSFSEGSSITINASASPTSAIQKIEFYAGSTKLGEDLTYPYSFTWSNVLAGNYELVAWATNTSNAKTVSPKINIAVNTTVNCGATGTISREIWNNVSGTLVSDIPLATSPSATGVLNILEAPQNIADNYGQRIRGYICAPQSGSYTFWIASDDNSELWLSTSSNPANKQKIAYVAGWTFSREWSKYTTQRSAAINLVAGQKYYIEVLHKEGAQGDNLAVGWQLPNGTLEQPIPGSRLSPFAPPFSVNITSPTNNSSIPAGSNVTILAEGSGGSGGIQKVEFFAGATKLGEDLTSPYSYTWSQPGAGNYELTAKATDYANNVTISSKVNISVVVISPNPCSATGNITREVWTNISGTSVTDIPVNTNPGSTSQLTSFEAPQNFGDNYGQRIRGYVCPPSTGNYVFWIASDDNSELWLSSGESPANKQKVAYVSGWTYHREWTKYPTQQSAPVYLVAGQKYYIEALHKEGGQGDHISVGWQISNGMLERPIPGNRLSPYSTPQTPVVSITSPANNTSYNEPASIIINANASVSGKTITKVEFFQNSIKIGEDLSAPFSITWSNVTAGNYVLTAKATDSQNLSGTSAAVNIIVNSASSCSNTQTILREYWANYNGSLASAPFGSPPTGTSQLALFEGPQYTGDFYASRIRGYVCPPTTGNYTFWISSDDQSELYISTDNNPANKIKRAYVPDWTMAREWTKYPYQQSPPIYLVAGQKYYIEAIHRDGSQGDHLAVGWALPNGTLERPIPGTRLSTIVSSGGGNNPPSVVMTSPTNGQRFSSPVNITLMANASDVGGSVTKVEFYERTTKLGEITTSPYNFGWFNVTTGNYTLTAKAYDNLGAVATSAPVSIEVTSCTTPFITAQGPTTFCNGGSVVLTANSGYEQYQWKVNGVYETGATGQSYVATKSGEYQIKTVKGSCVAWSAPVYVTVNNCKPEQTAARESADTSAVSKTVSKAEPISMKVFPNPNNGMFTVEMAMSEVKEGNIEVTVVNSIGQTVLQNQYAVNSGHFAQQIELDKNLPTGVYILKVAMGKNVETVRLILTR